MVQSPSWEANWFAASQEIPRISRSPKVHYRTHKRPTPVSILGQLNPVHTHIPPPGDPSFLTPAVINLLSSVFLPQKILLNSWGNLVNIIPSCDLLLIKLLSRQ